MAEYLDAEVIEECGLPTPLVWVEHYPEHEGGFGKYSLVRFSSWEVREAILVGIGQVRVAFLAVITRPRRR